MTDTLDAAGLARCAERVLTWVAGGCSSWGTPDGDIKALAEAALATPPVAPPAPTGDPICRKCADQEYGDHVPEECTCGQYPTGDEMIGKVTEDMVERSWQELIPGNLSIISITKDDLRAALAAALSAPAMPDPTPRVIDEVSRFAAHASFDGAGERYEPETPSPRVIEGEPIEAYYARQIEWSRATFGHGTRTGGVIDHIRKELKEIEAEPTDLSEWIDVIILAMDGFWRHGGSASDLMPRLLAKQQKNIARVWPDWRTMSEDSAIEHDRSHDTASPSVEALIAERDEARVELGATVRKFNCDNAKQFWGRIQKLRERAESAEAESTALKAALEDFRRGIAEISDTTDTINKLLDRVAALKQDDSNG